MKKHLLFIATCFLTYLASAQVLLTEDFNSYPAGHLNTDYTGATAGQGGWVTKRHASAIATAMVTPESGKGNVLNITTTGTFSNEYVNVRHFGIDALWNNRTVGNNVFKMEYEVKGSGFFFAGNGIENSSSNLMFLNFQSTTVFGINSQHVHSTNGYVNLKTYTVATFPYDMWIKAELLIDFNTNKAYFYIPTLNLFRADAIDPNFNKMGDNIIVHAGSLKPGSVVKYDNINLSALQTVPTYILSAHNIVSAVP